MGKLTIKKLLPATTSNSIPKNNNLNTTYIGIDFGTSTTVVSLSTFDSETSNVISKPIELNQKLYDGSIYKSYKIPTMVAWYNNKLLIGEGANKIKLKLKQGKNLWHSFKMELGEDVGCKYPQSELNSDKLTIQNPKDVTKIFFKYLKVQIEKYVEDNSLASNIEYAISIPASFEANQRKDLIDSLNANGMLLNKQAFIDEPNAAFLSYVSHPKLKSEIVITEDYPTNILVFDFGAGTCDVSILEVGYNPKGFYSKNLSISRFEALGGNDIDKLIAIDILLPQFLKENKKESKFFKTKELTQHIIPRLEKAAEILKVKMSEQLALLDENQNINQLIDDNNGVESNHTIEIKSRKGIFTLHNPKLSYKEFFEINSMFTNTDTENTEYRINDESEFKSIYLPIFTALKKAYLDKDDIDYLLFIGGSSKNLLIQKSLKNYFDETEHLIPENLQAHVSSGAAIHSLIFNGFGRNIIEPITSEPIIIVTKDGYDEVLKIIVKAGTIIPCETIIIDNLTPQRDGQRTIEIPICVGNKNKIVHNIKVENPDLEGFKLNTKIELKISINSDKMLIVEADINGSKIKAEPLNPFSNKEVSARDKKKFKAEKEFNKLCALNHGVATKSSLKNLYTEYEKLELELKAAEILEELYDKFDDGSLNNIGLHYSNAGDEEKAMLYYEKAMDEKPSEITAFNIAIEYKYSDRKLYIKWIKKAMEINPSYINAYYSYGVILVENGDDTTGYELINKAFDSWKIEYENDNLSSHVSWFISCAKFLNKYDYAKKLESESDDIKYSDEESYNSSNLTSMKSNINQLKEI
ncbi:MAG TPA: molecular chaperone DnaK [Flavobacteriaceae bacterium]|nr:molecular chaperone DnaK [Flavobacteriaceae bacterium]